MCFEIFISVFSCRQKISISLHECQQKTKQRYIGDLFFGISNQNKGNSGHEKLFIGLILFLFFFLMHELLSLQLEDHQMLILLISLHGSCFTPTHVLF